MSEKDKKKKDSALRVNEGVDKPSSINQNVLNRFKGMKRNLRSPDEYVEGILKGNRSMLSQAITLVESNLPAHHQLAQEIIEKCLPYSGNSIRIGITGVPGVGKSTFIEAMGKYLTDAGHKLAVLAIDPSSARSKGSILGDKTRMEDLSNNPQAFIRPSPSAGSLGGVARKTRETIILCESFGFDVIFVETVGVGQSEVAVHSMVDFFLLLMLAGAGDELQGIKRGIMEMADAIVVNKADCNNVQNARMAAHEYNNALHLYPVPESGWAPKVDTCSSKTKEGINRVWQIIREYEQFAKGNGYFRKNRQEQAKQIMYDAIEEKLESHFYQNPHIKKVLPGIIDDILSAKISSYVAAQKLLETYFERLKNEQ